METSAKFVRTPECLELIKRIYCLREVPPEVAAALEGWSSEPGILGQFTEKIRNDGSVVRGIDSDAYAAALQLFHQLQF
jgi:hypothetical protein